MEQKKVKECPRGHCVWIYRKSEAYVSRVLEYNQLHPETPIRILFVCGGLIEVTRNGGHLPPMETERLRWFRARLPQGVEIHACLETPQGETLAALEWSQQEALAQEVAKAIDTNPDIQGVHFDIEPYRPGALPFYIYMKKYCAKSVGAAVSGADAQLLGVLDFPVLMGYDLASEPPHSPKAFGAAAARIYTEYARAASAAGTCYFVGVPFISTWCEFEYRKNRKTNIVEHTPWRMEAYVREALHVFEKEHFKSDPYYAGVGIWGFLEPSEPGVSPLRLEWGTYPHLIKEECWALLPRFA